MSTRLSVRLTGTLPVLLIMIWLLLCEQPGKPLIFTVSRLIWPAACFCFLSPSMAQVNGYQRWRDFPNLCREPIVDLVYSMVREIWLSYDSVGSRGVSDMRSFLSGNRKKIDFRSRRFPSGNTGKAGVNRSCFKGSSSDRRISPRLRKSHLTPWYMPERLWWLRGKIEDLCPNITIRLFRFPSIDLNWIRNLIFWRPYANLSEECIIPIL